MKKFLFLIPALAIALGFSACNKCKKADCQNNASCEKKEGKCVCTEFYEGDKCENEIRKKYYGKYSGNASIQGTPFTVPVTMSAYGSRPDQLKAVIELIGGESTMVVTLSDPDNYTTDKVSTSIISPMDGKPLDVTVSGSGKISSSSLTGTFIITGDFFRNGTSIPLSADYSGTK